MSDEDFSGSRLLLSWPFILLASIPFVCFLIEAAPFLFVVAVIGCADGVLKAMLSE
jgi:hypothetical protein